MNQGMNPYKILSKVRFCWLVSRLDVDEVDTENSVCMTWSIDPSGTMRHRKTGTKVSTKEGITRPGDFDNEVD